MQNVTNEFRTAMQSAGIIPPDEIIPDGKLYRFKINGKPNGWYKCHADGRANGTFGDWSTGISERWMSSSTRQYSESEKSEFKANAKKNELAQQALLLKTQSEAAQKAQYIWDKLPLAPDDHPYLIRKVIKSHGAKLGRENNLILPLRNENGEIVSLSFISGVDGSKRLLSGGRKKGCFHSLGRKPTLGGTICLSESFSTASTIYQQLGHQVFISFGADNLLAVAKLIRSKRPDAQIWVMGDNNINQVGQKAAQAAALAVDGMAYIPPDVGDWNDFVNAGNSINLGGVL